MMNALNFKHTFQAVIVLLAHCSFLPASASDEVPVSVEVGPATAEPQDKVASGEEVDTNSDNTETPLREWKLGIATVKSNWLKHSDAATIRQDIQSGCTALQYRQLQELDPDPLNFGPSLALGRPGYVATFESVSHLAEQIAWLKSHGLLMDWTSSLSYPIANEISDGVLVNIPLIKDLSANRVWEVRLFQDQVTADYIGGPFKRLEISRVLNNGPANIRKSTTESTAIDVTKFSVGADVGGASREAYTLNFFPLLRDDVVRRQLSSTLDGAVFFIVYPDDEESSQVLSDAAAGRRKTSHFRYAFGDYGMMIHEPSIPIHGWEATSGHNESNGPALKERTDASTNISSGAATATETSQTSTPPGSIGFGNGGFSDPGLAGNQRKVWGREVIIAWSETNDELRGFSQKTGDWETVRIDPQKEIVPIVSTNMGAVRIGDSIAAFSGENCHWDVIELSRESKAQPTVSNSLVQIEDNGHLYTFAAEKGMWTSPTDMTLQPTEWEKLRPEIRSSSRDDYSRKVLQLIKEFRKWNETLPRYKKHQLQVALTSGREGTIEYRASRQRWMPELKAKIEELCRLVEVSETPEKTEGVTDSASPVADVKELEDQIQAMQSKLNALRSSAPEISDAAPQPDKVALRKQVEQAFDVRQQLQTLEAEKLRLKLQMIETSLENRLKNRERIIERRVEELLTSEIDAPSAFGMFGQPIVSVAGMGPTPAWGMPQTGTPIGLPGPPKLPLSGADGLKSHTVRTPNEDPSTGQTESLRIQTPALSILASTPEKQIHAADTAPVNQQATPSRPDPVSWDELRKIEINLRGSESEVKKLRKEVAGVQSRLNNYRTACSVWDPAAREEFRTAVNVERHTPRTGPRGTIRMGAVRRSVHSLDLQRVFDVNHDRYVEEQILRFMEHEPKPVDGPAADRTDPVPTTDEMLERLRLDLVRMLEEVLARDLSRERQHQQHWRDEWEPYQARVRFFQLDVEVAEASLVPLIRQLDRMKKSPKGAYTESEIEKQEAQVRLAEIQLRRALELLKLYTDIEKNHPQLNPDYKDPEVETAVDGKSEH